MPDPGGGGGENPPIKNKSVQSPSAKLGPSEDAFTTVGKNNKSKCNSPVKPTTSPGSVNSKISNNKKLKKDSTVSRNHSFSSSHDIPMECNHQINSTILSTKPTSASINNVSINNNHNLSVDDNLLYFPNSYSGTPHIIIEPINESGNLANMHPVKVGQNLTKIIHGIQIIKPIGRAKTRITLDNILNANKCLSSPKLAEYGYKATIPSTLIYSFGIIYLDTSIKEDDFWEGIESNSNITSFKRISIFKNGVHSPTRIVELKFKTPILPKLITIFKVIFKVSPSIRSPIQCKNCLRFGHTAKFCRSKVKCSHCGSNEHSESNCPSINTSSPVCFYCKLGHKATDRSCSQWIYQKDIKKIMAFNNVSYADAVILKKKNIVNAAHNFSEIITKNLDETNVSLKRKEPSLSPVISSPTSFPSLSTTYRPRRSKDRKRSSTPPPPFNYPRLPPYSAPNIPNGSFLKFVLDNKEPSDNGHPELSWIPKLADEISHAIHKTNLSSSSPSDLYSLIVSSLLSALSTSGTKEDDTSRLL